MIFGFWELRLRRQLSNNADGVSDDVSGLGLMKDLSEKIERERILERLPKEDLTRLRTIVGLKFIFLAILIIEVIVLQR